MVHPNVYHWANVLEKQGMHELLDNNPTWRAHFDALMPLLKANLKPNICVTRPEAFKGCAVYN